MNIQEKPVILYDGICGLCNRWVRFVLRRDKKDVFRFASLQSPYARAVLHRYGLNLRKLDTVYVITDPGETSEKILSRSRAILYVLRRLGGFWGGLAFFGILTFPLLDFFYAVVARSRYFFFGKYDSCPLPDPKDAKKFIEI